MKKYPIALVWMRRDLRLTDHRALSEATKQAEQVHIIFNFDPHILDPLPTDDRRVTFIMESLKELEEKLQKNGSSLWITYGPPEKEIPQLIKKLKVKCLFYNHDYEPYAKERDRKVERIVTKESKGSCEIQHFKDSVIFEGGEILTQKGEIYKVFTPFKKAWYEKLSEQERVIPLYKVNLKAIAQNKSNKLSILNHDWYKTIGHSPTQNELLGGSSQALKRLKKFENDIIDYEQARDFPALEKTSLLSVYIRHGNLSIRDMFRIAFSGSTSGHQCWASELIWREFYTTILDQFPFVVDRPFRPEYSDIDWKGRKKEWDAWQNGQTGYPIIDAAMRCLNETGIMHNRLRMVVASFLCKTLLIDWKKGEKYFALKLLDFDLAANNGGWQWSASTGTDAQPYFRIFNPYSQSQKFDPDGIFIKKWCPELKNFKGKNIHQPSRADMIEQAEAHCNLGTDYPLPVVDYKEKRNQALAMYKEIKIS